MGVCAEKIRCGVKTFALDKYKNHLLPVSGNTVLFFVLRFQGNGLIAPYADKGIVSLEFANSQIKAAHLFFGWKADGLLHKLRNNILIDFLFIPFYVMLFYTLCGSISVRLNSIPAKLGVLLAFFSLIAGLFDVCENILMLGAYMRMYNNVTTMATTIFATLKFTMIILSILYVIVFGGYVLRLKFSR